MALGVVLRRLHVNFATFVAELNTLPRCKTVTVEKSGLFLFLISYKSQGFMDKRQVYIM